MISSGKLICHVEKTYIVKTNRKHVRKLPTAKETFASEMLVWISEIMLYEVSKHDKMLFETMRNSKEVISYFRKPYYYIKKKLPFILIVGKIVKRRTFLNGFRIKFEVAIILPSAFLLIKSNNLSFFRLLPNLVVVW